MAGRAGGNSVPTASSVSVVIPHYGDPAPALALIAMLEGQFGGRPSQVIVSDDASPVPFPETPGAEVVRRETNGGFGSAVNSGVALAREELLLILNSDLTVGPEFVRDLTAAALPWLPAVLGPLVRDDDGTPAPTARHFPTAAHQGAEWLTPLARFRSARWMREAVGHDTRALPGEVLPVDWVVGAALLLRTEDFRSVGGFDERFFMNSEEIDLQRRLRERGIPSVFVGTVTVHHTGGGSSDPERRRAWLVRSRFTYAEKWGSPARLRATLTAATAVNAAVNTGRRVLGRSVHPVDVAKHELDLLRGSKP